MQSVTPSEGPTGVPSVSPTGGPRSGRSTFLEIPSSATRLDAKHEAICSTFAASHGASKVRGLRHGTSPVGGHPDATRFLRLIQLVTFDITSTVVGKFLLRLCGRPSSASFLTSACTVGTSFGDAHDHSDADFSAVRRAHRDGVCFANCTALCEPLGIAFGGPFYRPVRLTELDAQPSTDRVAVGLPNKDAQVRVVLPSAWQGVLR
eukprot:scaffold844_cov254-Pinguiococcus_pyrenoidosus.AAC.7